MKDNKCMNAENALIMTYEDVADIFDTGTVWCSKHERYWYMFAWSQLVRQNKTIYSSEAQRYKVLFYAFTLIQIYHDFCADVFDEYSDDLYYTIIEFLSDEVIINVAREYIEDVYDYEDISDAVNAILPHLKMEVFSALKKTLTAFDIFVWMYCTGHTFYRPVKIEANDSDDIWAEEKYEVNSYEDFAEMVKEEYATVLNDWVGNGVAGFDYLCTWMQ